MRNSLFILLFSIAISVNCQSLGELYQQGLSAYDSGDYELFTDKMSAIDNLRPNYPAVVYNLACGYALMGKSKEAIKTLNQYILMDASRDFTSDSDLQSLTQLPEFAYIQIKQKSLTEEILPSSTFSHPILASHPESMTYSKKNEAYFVGGVRDGKIWKLTQNKEPEEWAESTKNSWAVMGLEISPDEKTLWACTSSMSNYMDYHQAEEGFASVLKYSLKNGKLLETYALPGGHNFGDLICDEAGTVYISDGIANKVYTIDPNRNQLVEFADLSDQIFNLQGLTLDTNQENLYLSDYIDGIYKLNLATKEITKLQVQDDEILIKGIDGLYFRDNYLIGLHNGTTPNRVVQYTLSDDGTSLLHKKVLAQKGKLGEPTQGVWVNDLFHFIMNSPWGSYDQDGNFSIKEEKMIIGVLD